MFSGHFSPNSQIILTRQSSTDQIGVFATDATGAFVISLQLRFTHNQNLCLIAQDADGVTSRPLCVVIELDNPKQSFTNIVLPPTLRIEKPEQDKVVVISGYTLPNARVRLGLDGVVTETIGSDERGFYTATLIIDDYDKHGVWVQAIRESLISSPKSETQYFQILPPFLSKAWLVYVATDWQVGFIAWARQMLAVYADWWWLILILFELLVIFTLISRHHRRHKVNRSQVQK